MMHIVKFILIFIDEICFHTPSYPFTVYRQLWVVDNAKKDSFLHTEPKQGLKPKQTPYDPES